MKQIATVALLCGDRLLIGRRTDDHRWNLPGGQADEGESPEAAAERELKEETGIVLPPGALCRLCSPKEVLTYTGKQLRIHPFYAVVPTELAAHREGTDPGEAHDWSWVNVSNGLPPDISMNWHNKTDAALEALGIGINQVDVDKQDIAKSDDLEKAWPKHYNRVKGQDKDLGVASGKQKRFMQAVASGKVSGHAPSPEEAKDYLKNTGSGANHPESGSGGERGRRERAREDKRKEKDKKKDKAEKAVIPKADDAYSESRQAEHIKRQNRIPSVTFGDQIKQVKQKLGEKKPKTFEQEVAEVKARHKTPMAKSADLFYAKVEGCLKKGVDCEELLSHMMDLDLILADGDKAELYKSADRLFDSVLTPEEQVVYELSYMAQDGCESSLHALVKFTEEMGEELLKSVTVEDAVAELIKAKRDGVCHPNKKPKDPDCKPFMPIWVFGSRSDSVDVPTDGDGDAGEGGNGNGSGGMEMSRKADKISGGLADKKKPSDFDQDALNAGIKVEMEHTDDRTLAREIAMDHLTEDPHYYKKLKTIEKSEDNSKVVGKKNGHSVRRVHNYLRYTSGPKRGEYVHRHEAEKRLGRKLSRKEHVNHKSGNRRDNSAKNTKVMSASKHAAETNKERAKGGGTTKGGRRIEHTRD